jgi:hypothetical protein
MAYMRWRTRRSSVSIAFFKLYTFLIQIGSQHGCGVEMAGELLTGISDKCI